MTEGNIRMRTNERTEVDFFTRGHCKARAAVWKGRTLCLYTIHLGYMEADGLETPVKGSTLDAYKRSI